MQFKKAQPPRCNGLFLPAEGLETITPPSHAAPFVFPEICIRFVSIFIGLISVIPDHMKSAEFTHYPHTEIHKLLILLSTVLSEKSNAVNINETTMHSV